MGKLAFAIIIALALLAITHAAVSGASLSRLVSQGASPPSTTYTVPYETQEGNSTYFLVAFYGTPHAYAKLWEDGDSTFGQFVSSQDEALMLVGKNLESRGANATISSLANSAALRISNLSSNFKASQAECRRIMGLEGRNCISYDTCLSACSHVPTFCMQIAQQSGSQFIYALWQYENDTRDYFALEKDARAASVLAAAYPSEKNLAAFDSSLEKLGALAQRLTTTGVLVREMYCAPPFPANSIEKMRLDIANARMLLREISQANPTAAKFAEGGAALNGNATLPFDLTAKIETAQPENNSGASAQNQTAEGNGAFSLPPEVFGLAPFAIAILAVALVAMLGAYFAAKKLLSKIEK